jgi:integrase
MHNIAFGSQHQAASMQFLEPRELRALLRVAKTKGVREWAMTLVAYKHGMRASEVCDLRLDDVDLRNGHIVIRRLKGSLRTIQALPNIAGSPF